MNMDVRQKLAILSLAFLSGYLYSNNTFAETVTPASTQSNTPAPAPVTLPVETPAPAAPVAATPVAATPAPAATAPVATAQAGCPCSYTEAEALKIFLAIKRGAAMCTLGSVKAIGQTSNPNAVITNTALLMMVDSDKAASAPNRDEANKIAMTTWLIGYDGNPEKLVTTNYCTKNKWDPTAKVAITSASQYQACLVDIKRAAKVVGITCGSE